MDSRSVDVGQLDFASSLTGGLSMAMQSGDASDHVGFSRFETVTLTSVKLNTSFLYSGLKSHKAQQR